MPPRMHRATALVAAVLITSLAGPAGAGATAARTPAGRTPAMRPGAAAAPGAVLTAPLTLVDGDQALPGSAPSGPDATVVRPAPGTGQATSVAGVRMGSRGFLIPLTAVPYLGHGLDLSLFDVDALQRAEQGGRLPVTLRYHGRLRPVPGIIMTRAGPGTAEGYLTPASAARFGAALTQQGASPAARGGYNPGGLFAGGLSVTLAGARPGVSALARPAAPTRTVTVTGTTLAGRPDTGGLVLVGDVDNANVPGTGLTAFRNGIAKFAGPPGPYWALAVFAQRSASGKPLSYRMDVLPQFTVTGNTTVHLTARAATSKITFATPRPALTQTTTLTLVRAAPHAPPSGLSPLVQSFGFTSGEFPDPAGLPLWVSPVRQPPGHGTLRVFTSGQLTSPPGQQIPYAYTLDFADSPGTIPPQHFAARPADLAVVSERYFQDLPTVAAWETLGGTPYQLATSFYGAAAFPLHVPARQVQYLSASPPMLWQSFYSEYRSISPGQTPGGQTSAWRLLHGGQQLTQTWGQYPLHPGPDVSFVGTPAILASADRAGNTLNLDVTPFSDNQPGDTGDGFDVPSPASVNEVGGSYALYQDGVKIAGAAVGPGGTSLLVSAPLSPRPALIKFVVAASRASSRYHLSATGSDVWTWHSRPQPGVTLPAPWLCGLAAGVSRRCAVQPMITLDYQVAGLGLDGAAGPGRQVIAITAGHIQLAPPVPVTLLQAQVSLDGGRSWQAAQVWRAGPGRFGVAFTAPPSALVSLRVTATDGAGNSLCETILRAYRTSA